MIGRSRRGIASTAIITAGALALTGLAFAYDGVPTADLDLNDGGVWVTNSAELLVGHLNFPSRTLDGGVRVMHGDFDILQQGDDVVVHNETDSSVMVVDPANVLISEQVSVPGGTVVALGGGIAAILADDRAFAVPLPEVGAATFDPTDALVDGGFDAIGVSVDGGVVFAVSAADALLTRIVIDGAGGMEEPEVTEVALEGVGRDSRLSVTTVGRDAVVLDATTNTLYPPRGAAVPLPETTTAVLQQPSADARGVVVSTTDELLHVSLARGEVETLAEAGLGIPSPAVVVDGCTHGVWSGSAVYVRVCAGEEAPHQVAVPEATPADDLVLRANRRVVVINSTTSGMVWLPSEEMVQVNNWDDLIPPQTDDPDDEDEEESQDDVPLYDLPDRSADNRPPIANDDEYGVRAGRSTILRVTENDTDPDGDLLSARVVGSVPEGWRVDPVLDGAALQVTVPPEQTGTRSFRYRIDDGYGHTDEASVYVSVVGTDAPNRAPVQTRVRTVKVELGATLVESVLDDWEDPDGDEFFVKSASVDSDDIVRFRSNGTIEFISASGEVGLNEVDVVMSDGLDETVGKLLVEVRPKGTLGPIAYADRVSTRAGVPVTISPLANDVSPSGQRLRLAKIDDVPGLSATADYSAGTILAQADKPGVYYIQYLVTDGPGSAAGLIRMDVLDTASDGLPPVAAADIGLLPAGREVLVDVLANDVDPAGGILVVQSAQADPQSRVSVEVLEHRVLRITDLATLEEPTLITYSVSNGTQSAIGEVQVIPVPLPQSLRPPITNDDRATVRVGDVVNIPVLANDYHPDHDTLTLLPDLAETDVTESDRIFVDGDRVRFHAGDEPGTVHATYVVSDSQRQETAGYITIQVLPVEDIENSRPRPQPVTSRVIAGNTARIPIPLDGIDPDGDSVELLGLTSIPTLGRISVADTWIDYTAFEDAAGTDTFTYAVRDHQGATSESTITVGVASQADVNQAPYAVSDLVVVKPGRKVAVPVTANDFDPDGDEILILSGGLEADEGIDPKVEDGLVVFTAPAEPGQYMVTYTIQDTWGARDDGQLMIIVDPDAPALPPIARDDWVPRLSVTSEVVRIDVLENDEDPDGTVEDLRVSIPGEQNARVNPDNTITVPLAEDRQVIRYEVRDLDGNTAQAFAYVPGLSALVPMVFSTEPVVVDSGATVLIPLADHVRVRDDRVPRISIAETLRANHSSGASLIEDEWTLSYTSAAGYWGPDTIGVEVTDGSGPDDPEGLSAYVLIPVEVLEVETPEGEEPEAETEEDSEEEEDDAEEEEEEAEEEEDVNISPTLMDASLEVAPGEAPATLNLIRLAQDPDPGDMENLRFTLASTVPGGFNASISGAVLTVDAPVQAQPGETFSLTVTVDDGTSEPGQGTITVRTVASQRPLPVANDDVVEKAHQGQTQTVDVLANDYNPFPDRGPLEILSTRVESGDGTAAVTGESLEITPGADFFGTMIVSYRIVDATGSPDRTVSGQVHLTVQGRPDAPATPMITAVENRRVVLSWDPPSNNGSRITGYTVTSDKGTTHSCSATTCTLDGLTNDVEYRFSVVATNAVGESEASPQSAGARPDTRPEAPIAPQLSFGDKSLSVTWNTPVSKGSPVLSYDLEVSPAPPVGQMHRAGVTGNTMTWEGLENGVAYTVRVRAVNRAPDPSDWSTYSAEEVPAGIPAPPGAPSAKAALGVGAQSQVTVTWPKSPNENGDAISTYRVSATGGDGQTRTIETSDRQATFTVPTSTNTYSFSVTGTNKAGTSATSAGSNQVRAANAPGAPSNVSVSATGTAGQLSVSATPGAWNGNATGDVTWHWSGAGGKSGTVSVTSISGTSMKGTISGATNGTNQSIQLWANSGLAGASGKTTSNSAKPWGPLAAHSPTAKVDGDKVCFSWNLNGVLNGQEMKSVKYTIDSGQKNGSLKQNNVCSKAGWSTKRSLSLTLTTKEGKTKTYTANATTGKKPDLRKVTVSMGTRGKYEGCQNACKIINVNASGFPANKTVAVKYYTGGELWRTHTLTTTSSGTLVINENRKDRWYTWYGYEKQVYVTVDGVKSNVVNWNNR